jgi:DNA-binding XRE family transcriptional regulator
MKTPFRIAREKRNLTLGAMAVLVGSDVGNLSRIERGTQVPNRALAEKICALFDNEVSEIQLIYPNRIMQETHKEMFDKTQTP